MKNDKIVDELNEEIRVLENIIRQAAPEKIAYAIIKVYFQIENPSEEMHAKFLNWLFDDRNADAKTEALLHVFEEIND